MDNPNQGGVEARNNQNQVEEGVTFGAPVERDTDVTQQATPQAQAQQSQGQDLEGVTFGAPVANDTDVSQQQQSAQQPTPKPGIPYPDEIGANRYKAGAYESSVPFKAKEAGQAAGDEALGIIKGAAIHSGAVGAAEDVWDVLKQIPPVYRAYENARSRGASILDSVKAANDEAGR